MMKKRKIITKYLVPVLFALLVAVAFVVGIFYIRSYMVKQTAKERSSQLEEMISQIRANMDSGIENHWNLLMGIKATVEGKCYDSEKELSLIHDQRWTADGSHRYAGEGILYRPLRL